MRERKKIAGVWDRINKVISDSGLSKSEVCRRCGFSRSVLAYEDKQYMPSIAFVAKFCAIMNCSADYILGLSNEYEYKVIKDIRLAEGFVEYMKDKAVDYYLKNGLAENETQAKVKISYKLNKETV